MACACSKIGADRDPSHPAVYSRVACTYPAPGRGSASTPIYIVTDGQRPLLNIEVDLLLVEAGQLDGDLDLSVGLSKLDSGPRKVAVEASNGWHAEAAEDVVEQTVHLTMQ